MKRVFIMGAGFSCVAGFPPTQDLFRELKQFYREEIQVEDSPKKYSFFKNEFDEEYAVVETLLSPSGIFEDFEEFISLLDAGIFEEFLDPVYETVRKGWLIILSLYLSRKLSSPQNVDLIKKFLKQIDPADDAIITFNWDNLLEYFFDELKKKWNYLNAISYSPEQIPILKLHGSVNWFSLGKDLRLKDENSMPRLREGAYFVPDYKNLEKFIEGHELQTNKTPFIIPPTYLKKYEEGGMRQLWGDAYRLLQEADEITILGYSLPPADCLPNLTLRLALTTARIERQRKVMVVNKSKKDCNRIKDMLKGPRIDINSIERDLVDYMKI